MTTGARPTTSNNPTWIDASILVGHEREGLKFLYLPVLNAERVRNIGLKRMVKTFFGGSPESAAAALLEMSDTRIAAKDKQYLSQLIRKAQQEGR